MRNRLIPPWRDLLVLLLAAGQALAQSEPVTVDASELTGGQTLWASSWTDDRVRFYQSHRPGDTTSFYLKRTDVVFRLPRVAPENSPRPMPVVVQGS